MRYKCASMSISEGGGVCVSLSAGDPDTVTMTGCESVCTIVTRCSSGSFSCSGLGNASMVLSTYLRSMGVMVGRLSVTVTGGSARGARYDGGPLYSEPHHAAPVDPLLGNIKQCLDITSNSAHIHGPSTDYINSGFSSTLHIWIFTQT